VADDLHGFAEWRDRIESRVSTLEVTVTTEARVRAQMDKDMSDLSVKFDAQEKLLKALRETQSDHTKRLTRLEAGQAKLEAGQAKLEAGQAKLEVGQAQVLAGVQTIIVLLDRETEEPTTSTRLDED
jgi:peptidoglycan hydrolase CwlO-like protein